MKMNKIQWYIFSGGFLLLGILLNVVSIRKGNMAISMINTDMLAFAAWIIISDMFFLFSQIIIGIGMIFMFCGFSEGDK